MADDKKNTPDVAPPTEAPSPTAEVTAVPEPLAPNPVPTDAEAVKQKPPTEKDKPAKPGRGRLPKDGKGAADKAK